MCGRFSILDDQKKLAEHFGLDHVAEYKTSYNVTPSSDIPIVRLKDQEKELVTCHWGLIPHWAKDTKFQPINAKAETVASKPFFRSAFKHNRCLIPANGFYEWKGAKGHKQPYYFKLKDAELFAFAGLWDHWESLDKTIESCTIITTSANAVMAPIHNRMPVILALNHYAAWLHEGPKELLTPYAGVMICYPVSSRVNSPKNDGKDLVEPLSK
ncbi:MAG: SOS response-associated peptidase [Gammaproteobacteria bacterium]|nr:SOS response-associated peptidase [Gammaproteobacteria bacterium]